MVKKRPQRQETVEDVGKWETDVVWVAHDEVLRCKM